MDLASLKHLANSGALDEISNISDGEGIESKVKMSGLTRDGKTKKAVLFVIYQTECHGPQNGFRLALVEEGVMPHDAREILKGFIAQDAAEFVRITP